MLTSPDGRLAWPTAGRASGSRSLIEAAEVAKVMLFMLTRPRGMTIRDVVMMPTNFRSLNRTPFPASTMNVILHLAWVRSTAPHQAAPRSPSRRAPPMALGHRRRQPAPRHGRTRSPRSSKRRAGATRSRPSRPRASAATPSSARSSADPYQDDLALLIAAGADPATRIISFTVTGAATTSTRRTSSTGHLRQTCAPTSKPSRAARPTTVYGG